MEEDTVSAFRDKIGWYTIFRPGRNKLVSTHPGSPPSILHPHGQESAVPMTGVLAASSFLNQSRGTEDFRTFVQQPQGHMQGMHNSLLVSILLKAKYTISVYPQGLKSD